MDAAAELKRDLEVFQSAIRGLNTAIKKSNLEWRDAQFEKISQSVKTVADGSKKVIDAARECQQALANFERIKGEDYGSSAGI